MARAGKQVERPQEGAAGTDFKANMAARYGFDRFFTVVVTAAALVGVVVLAVLLVDVVRDGSGMLCPGFLTSFPS